MSASSSTGAATMMSASAADEGPNIIAEAAISSEGTFRLQTEVDRPRSVHFYVLDAVSPSGHKMAPVKGQTFILEPGELTLSMNERARFAIRGGYYNDAVFNSWKLSDDYVAAQELYTSLLQAVPEETEEERRNRVDRYGEVFSQILNLESEGRADVAMNHPDPLVRRLTIESAWLGGRWILESLRSLEEMTPDDPWVQQRLASAEENERKRAEARKIATGTNILEFTAETLSGQQVTLSDVRAESEVVLLEFWASWCGPCRVEIPHMKQAYEKYREHGFEIVSFTIDEEREAWVEASDEEQLPWINLGMGPEAEAPLAYNVTGVPANYLVRASDGTILAKDLRGHHLDRKLEELFN